VIALLPSGRIKLRKLVFFRGGWLLACDWIAHFVETLTVAPICVVPIRLAVRFSGSHLIPDIQCLSFRRCW
jgi:hypothetical protein